MEKWAIPIYLYSTIKYILQTTDFGTFGILFSPLYSKNLKLLFWVSASPKLSTGAI